MRTLTISRSMGWEPRPGGAQEQGSNRASRRKRLEFFRDLEARKYSGCFFMIGCASCKNFCMPPPIWIRTFNGIIWQSTEAASRLESRYAF